MADQTTGEKSQSPSWAQRMAEAIERQSSILCVGLDPVWDKLPDRFKGSGVAEGIYAYNCQIIDAAAPYAAAFKPQYKCYSAEGTEGIEALKRTCEYIKLEYPHIPIILDAKYADIGHVLERCAYEAFSLFEVDAVTAMPSPGKQALAPLYSQGGKGCFMVVRTSNPGAEELQDLMVQEGGPLYIATTRRISGGWNESGNIGVVAPATEPRVLANVRAAAPDLPILCPGVGAQGGDLEAAVEAGLDSRGAGLLINVSRAIMEAPDPGKAAEEWHGKLETARASVQMNRGKTKELSIGETPEAKGQELLAEVVLQLFDIGAIRFESVTLKSGLVSPYYNNLRIIASYPQLMRKVAALLAQKMEQAGLKPDVLIGIAHAGVPLAVGLSLETGLPAGYVRSAAKQHGTKGMVEGAWQTGAKALLVDDVVSDGASKLEVLDYLRDAGLEVKDILVVVDRNQGGPELMERNGLHCYAVATMNEVLDILRGAGKITDAQVEESHKFMTEAQAQSSH